MESLREKIKNSLNKNIKAKDSVVMSTLRLVLAAIKDRDIEFRSKKKVMNSRRRNIKFTPEYD